LGYFAMGRYSGLVKEHFLNPRNVGDVSDPTTTGRVGSVTCGAAVRLSLRVDDSQRIIDARFRAAGCGFLVAAASLLTDQIKGSETGEAAALAQSPGTTMPKGLGEVPAERQHCAALAGQALVAAIKSYSDSIRDQWSGDEALICTCFCVSESTIAHEIEQGGLRTIAEVTQACNAGGGCRSCYSLIEDLLNDHWRDMFE
jgi:NifU-like protein